MNRIYFPRSSFCEFVIALAVLISNLFVVSDSSQAAWPPPEGLPVTRWAKEVSPDKPVLPEYPRPQLVRHDWINLNGVWEYAIAPKNPSQNRLGEGDSPRFFSADSAKTGTVPGGFARGSKAAEAPSHFDGKILVPFPPQSVLSQVNRSVDDKSRIWYRRKIEIPAAWAGRSVLLNFGAVNWESHVFVNGIEVGAHTGGYDAFSCDITDALKGTGPQELVVSAWNPIEGGQPHGKQALKPDGIFYTPTTGIWQTVWLEPVGKSYIEELRMVPDVDHSQLKLTVNVKGAVEDETVEAVALADGKEVGRASGKPGAALTIALPYPRLWWPASPFLYDLKVTLSGKDKAAGAAADSVESYFGMRKMSVGPDATGHARILLNNKPVFQNGFFDQGFWPEGIYTAPTDDALKYDLQMLKQFGYNMDRKHIKVEPDRWYYWADRLGVLVWQDMPAVVELKYPPNSRSIPDREGNYESELRRMIRGRFNHPSIVMWILFNEGWGLPEKDRKNDRERLEASPVAKARELRMVTATREEDPTRLIDAESGTGGGGNDHDEGLFDFGYGDVVDYHCYGHDGPVAETGPKGRAGIVGEYGWGLATVGALRNRMESSKGADISGCVVTQLTDVENEHNGALKYDRTIVRNVELEKDIPGGILRVLHEYGENDYPGGPTMSP